MLQHLSKRPGTWKKGRDAATGDTQEDVPCSRKIGSPRLKGCRVLGRNADNMGKRATSQGTFWTLREQKASYRLPDRKRNKKAPDEGGFLCVKMRPADGQSREAPCSSGKGSMGRVRERKEHAEAEMTSENGPQVPRRGKRPLNRSSTRRKRKIVRAAASARMTANSVTVVLLRSEQANGNTGGKAPEARGEAGGTSVGPQRARAPARPGPQHRTPDTPSIRHHHALRSTTRLTKPTAEAGNLNASTFVRQADQVTKDPYLPYTEPGARLSSQSIKQNLL